jgi:hypothetical protein
MSRPRIQTESLSPGQSARRWGLAADRVCRLVEGRQLPGAFRVPAVGRYGEAIRIPMAAVLQAEEEWAVVPTGGPMGNVVIGFRDDYSAMINAPDYQRQWVSAPADGG